MTPKEQAQHLHSIFEREITSDDCFEEAKCCAKICADKIKEQLEHHGFVGTSYWDLVKLEIKNL